MGGWRGGSQWFSGGGWWLPGPVLSAGAAMVAVANQKQGCFLIAQQRTRDKRASERTVGLVGRRARQGKTGKTGDDKQRQGSGEWMRTGVVVVVVGTFGVCTMVHWYKRYMRAPPRYVRHQSP
jgi:hypothetical protein